MKKLLILLVMLFLGVTLLLAQAISEYTYATATNGSLQDMSTGTTALLGPGTYYDDQSSVVANIGFTFTFGGTGYTQFSGNSNGQMALGAVAVGNYMPAFAAGLALLQPLSGDNAIMAAGKLHYKVVSSAPNRILVVEWLAFRIPYSSTGTGSKMQVWLYETTNVVKYIYGGMLNESAGALDRSVVISTGSVEGSIANVTTINTTPTYITTGVSIVTTSFAAGVMTNLNSAADGSRRVFSWTPPVASLPPNPALCVSPLTGAINVSESAVLSWSSGGGLPTDYDVYFGTNPSPAYIGNQTATSYDPPGALLFSQLYYWKIVPHNGNGYASNCPTWSFTTRPDPTIMVFPYTQNFEVWPPVNWDLTGGTYQFTQFLNGTNNWARANYWNQQPGQTDIMTTPPILTSVPLRVNFLWSHLYSATYPTDAFTLQVSSNYSDWTNLLYLSGPTDFNSNDGAGNMTPGTGVSAQVSIPVGYVGAPFYLRFFGYSGYGPDLFIDNVVVEEVPANPILTVVPATWDFGTALLNVPATKNFAITNTGGGALGITNISIAGDYYSLTVNPAPVSLGAGETANFTVEYTPAVEGVHTGTVTITDDLARAVTDIPLTGSGLDPMIYTADLPYSQNFDGVIAPALPPDWSRKQVTISPSAYVQTNQYTYYSVTNSAQLYNYDDLAADLILISPPIEPALNTLRVKFWAYGYGYPVQVGTVDVAGNAAVFTSMQIITIPSTYTWAQYTVSLAAYTGTDTYIAFRHALSGMYQSVYIDDVLIEALPTVPIFSLAPASWDFGLIGVGTAASKEFTISNTGGGTLTINSIVVGGSAYYTLTSVPALPIDLLAEESTSFTVQYYPTAAAGSPHTGNVTINDNRAVTIVPLSGSAGNIVNMTNGSTNMGEGEAWNFYDSGGSSAPYQASENYIYTFFPPAGFLVKSVFSYFVTESSYENLTVHNGSAVTDPVLGTYTGTATIPDFTSSHASGALTFHFTSDGSVQYEGWDAVITTVPVPVGPPDPVVLTYPADGATGLSKLGFNLTWNQAGTGGIPVDYVVYLSTNPLDVLGQNSWVTLNRYFNPVTEGAFAFEHEGVYYWTVIARNLDGESLPPTAYQFTIEPENIFGGLVLSGNVAIQDVILNWLPFYSESVGDGAWVGWDNGTNFDAIGTGGASTFSVASKFTTAILTPYIGQDLTSIKFFPYVDATYTVKVWSGTDIDLGPITEIWSQAVGTEIPGTWNEVLLSTSVPITGANALYIGYEVITTTGYPAGCDAGPAYAGIGDLIYFSGAWVSMYNAYTLNYNWNLKAYVTPGARARGELLNIPVVNANPNNVKFAQDLLTTDPAIQHNQNTRLLQGYNVYRDTALLTPTPISARTYTESDLAIGSYTYYVEAIFEGGTVTSNDWIADVVYVAPSFGYAPVSLNFGGVSQGVPSDWQNVTVINNGGDILNLAATDISIVGTDALMFEFDPVNLPAALANGESVIIPVRFTASSEGAKTATLRMVYNAVNYDVVLSGSGNPAGLIAIGTGTLDLQLPIEPFYGYSYSQSIFLQSEINMPGQLITKLYYNWNGYELPEVSDDDWVIYMGHTAQTEFATTADWVPYASLTQVYSGHINLLATPGWVEIVLDAPFAYNNVDNLVIAVDENEPGYDSSMSYFYCTDTVAPRSIIAYNDTVNPDPANPPMDPILFYTLTTKLGRPNVQMLFYTPLPERPDVTVLLTPPDLATGVSVPVNYTWTRGPGGGLPEGYYLSLADDPSRLFTEDALLNTIALSGTNYTPAYAYLYETTYYWSVYAYNVYGDGDPAVARSFTTGVQPLMITTIPYLEDFELHGDNSLPEGWARSTLSSGGWIIGTDYSSTYWTVPAHTVYAAANDDFTNDDSSMDLLVTPLINLSGVAATDIRLKFDSFYDYAYSATVEISVAGGPWALLYTLPTNPDWNSVSVDVSAYKSNVFQLRFHYNDLGVWAYGWAIDNVVLEEMPNWDASPLSIDMPEVVGTGAILPQATVINNGMLDASFDVTMSIGTWTDTQPVTLLGSGLTAQVTFASYTPVLETAEVVTVQTFLSGDQNPVNDTMNGVLVCLPLDIPALCDVAYDPTAVLDGPATFNLRTPGTITDLPSATPFTNFMAGADWINGQWLGTEYSSNIWWQIDPVTGAGTNLGVSATSLNGIAYDPNNDITYGVYSDGTNSSLYTINPANGTETLVGPITGFANMLIIGLAYDSWTNTLYAADISYDALFSIDPVTCVATGIGYFGLDLNYAQDLTFDNTNGYLYLAGYTTTGALYWIEPAYGGAYKIGDFQSGSEITGFAIPWGTGIEAPVVAVTSDGWIYWNAVPGASSYNIYSSDEPYGPFTLYVTVNTLSWGPPMTEIKKFYYVTADTGARAAQQNVQMRGRENLKVRAKNIKSRPASTNVYSPLHK
jgi:hypothetical protein